MVTSLHMPFLSVILPCFNEAENIKPIYHSLVKACEGIEVEFIFVDDGSSDTTSEVISTLEAHHPEIRLLRFVRNAGHQNALRAGYRAALGKWILTMDSDLQHPPEMIPSILAKANEGFEVVQMVRQGKQNGFLKNFFSRGFYKFFNSLSDIPMVEHASDFRLISRSVCDILNALPERNLIIRAILPYLGFNTAQIQYQLADRLHGQASFNFSKSMHMGSQALFNFSAFPLKLAMRVGFLISFLAFAYALYNVAAKFLTNHNVPGYTDVIASTLFLGGLILIYLGILGRYILVILDHLKHRPEYILSPQTRSKK